MRHPTYPDTGEPILIGDIVASHEAIYEVQGISATPIGTLVTATSADTGERLVTDDVSHITKAPDDVVAEYRDPAYVSAWGEAFAIADAADARICEVVLRAPSDPCPTHDTHLFALVPKDVPIEDMAPWVVRTMDPTTPYSVRINEVTPDYPAPRRMRAFVDDLVSTHDTGGLDSKGSLWLVPKDASPTEWAKTEIDKACLRLEQTSDDYDIEAADLARHIKDLLRLFAGSHVTLLEWSPEHTALAWWRAYALALEKSSPTDGR